MNESDPGMDNHDAALSKTAALADGGDHGDSAGSLAPKTRPGSSPRTPIRVVVVDDSALVRSILAKIIDREPDMRCVGTAADPLIAREVIREVNPDVVTLDIEMPRMDGLDFLGRLMRLRPTPVVMISTLTERGARFTLRALELGAVDFVPKPKQGVSNGLHAMGQEITDRIRAASRAHVRRLGQPSLQRPAAPTEPAPPPAVRVRLPQSVPAPVRGPATEKIIFVGASTGGTEATRELLQQLPADVPAVLIAQHMPGGFTRSYAERLDDLCPQRVLEAVDGARLLPGHVYIAPGGSHLTVNRSGSTYLARVQVGQPVNRHMPSVEVLFDSAAQVVGRHALGIMLTGMGADGALALRRMRDAGSFNLVQDEASSVVYGMPREAIAQGAAHEVLPLNRIAPRIVEWLRAQDGSAASRS